MVNDTGLSWYNISITARRGFCRECGSALFWDQLEQPGLGIIAGSLDQPTGLKTIGHIFVGSKSDFYEVQDAVPKFEGSSDGDLEGDHL